MNYTIPDDLDNRNFHFCEHSYENLKRAIPTTKKNINWKILLMMEKIEDDEIWLKVALQNKDTGQIALLTSTNKQENLTKRGSRGARTIDGEWYVGRYRMCAPAIFWKELKNRILYS